MEIHDLKKTAQRCLIISVLAIGASPLWAVSDGYVVKADNGSVFLDWGQASGVAVGDQFDVYHEGEELKHPVTGASLGKAQTVLTSGVLESIQEKFSTAKLLDNKAVVKAGDRTRHKSSAAPVPAAAAPAGVPTPANASPVSATPVPKELWRSAPISREATGLASGDLDGDGKPELAVAYRNQIEIYRWDGKALESVALLDSKKYRNVLALEIADVGAIGKPSLFASLYIEGNKRARTIEFVLDGKTLKEVSRVDGFVRAFDRANGTRELLWQDLSLSREMRIRQPASILRKNNSLSEGPVVKLPRALSDQQLFGFAWGDWDKDGVEDFAVLQSGEKLRMFFKDAKWSARDAYGGTNLDFSWEDEQIGSVSPRLLSRKIEGQPDQLLVPHNISATPIRLARLKIFKQGEILGFSWNGLEMAPQWILPVSGAIADFNVSDVTGQGAPQLWVAAVGSGDKTVLLSYQLP